MEIYIVTSGSYSDYHICGVYSDIAKAQEAVELYGDESRVEEFEVDVFPEHPPGLLAYVVYMDEQGKSDVRRTHVAGHSEWCGGAGRGQMVFSVWAKDEQHAVKIANEKRVVLIANGEWSDDWKVWDARRKS